MGKHSSNNHGPFGQNYALHSNLAPNDEPSVMEMKQPLNQRSESSNHDVKESILETRFSSYDANHQPNSLSTIQFGLNGAVDPALAPNDKHPVMEMTDFGQRSESSNANSYVDSPLQETGSRTPNPENNSRPVTESSQHQQQQQQAQQHHQPNSLSTNPFGSYDPVHNSMTDFGQRPESFHANSYVDSPLQETGSRTPNPENNSRPVTESSQQQHHHHQQPQHQQPQHQQPQQQQQQYHHQQPQLLSASPEGVTRSAGGNGVSLGPRGDGRNEGLEGEEQNVTSDALSLHEELEVPAVNDPNSRLGSMPSSHSSNPHTATSEEIPQHPTVAETRFSTSTNNSSTATSHPTTPDTISDTTSHTTISRATSSEDVSNRQRSYDISLANDSNDKRISVTKSSLEKRIGVNFNKKDNIRFQITEENKDLLELNSQDKSKYYAEFAGLELNGIKFKAEDKLFMANFRNVKFVNCDFSEIPPENFKTIKFYNCKFDGQNRGPNNSDLNQKNQAARDIGYTTNKKVDYKGLKSDIKSEADNIKELANHRRLDQMDVKEIFNLLQQTKTRGETEESEAKKPDSISAGIKSSLKRLSGRNQFQPSPHVKNPDAEQLIKPRIRQQS